MINSPNEHFTEANAADLIKQVLSALHYCHERGVMHRNLSEERVLYD
jgi:calcium-dependent protein kinase